jgi:hypothetical protein
MKWLLAKVMNLITYGVVSAVSTDTTDYPIMQISYMGRTANAARISPYGLCSNPPLKAKVVHWNVLAQEENKVGFAFSQQNRFKPLKAGEVVVGNPTSQSYIKFHEDGTIEIVSAKKVLLTGADDMEVTIAGDVKLTASGNVDVDATQVNLGVGGAQIARLGDNVTTIIGGTPEVGTITSAGINTSL